MSTWTLLLWLSYAACGGDKIDVCPVALDHERIDFFTRQQCLDARDKQVAEWKAAGFRRFTATCFDRTMPLEGPPFPPAKG